MPIYEYRCSSCGMQKDFLQKMSDPLLTDCPACKAKGTLNKMLSAAGFQLKGSGWYATDFKGSAKPATASATTNDTAPATTPAATATETKTESKTESKADPAPAAHVHSSSCSHN
jgi:putative FmdB family regulatory protein